MKKMELSLVYSLLKLIFSSLWPSTESVYFEQMKHQWAFSQRNNWLHDYIGSCRAQLRIHDLTPALVLVWEINFIAQLQQVYFVIHFLKLGNTNSDTREFPGHGFNPVFSNKVRGHWLPDITHPVPLIHNEYINNPHTFNKENDNDIFHEHIMNIYVFWLWFC